MEETSIEYNPIQYVDRTTIRFFFSSLKTSSYLRISLLAFYFVQEKKWTISVS